MGEAEENHIMDITTLAAWGEFLGGIAVVVSLIYLAGQIRQNSKLLRVSMTSAVADSDRALTSEMLNDPSLRRLWFMDTNEFESLPESEREKLVALFLMQMNILYRNYYFAKDGAIRKAMWEAENRGTTPIFGHDWARRCWRQARIAYSNEFGEYIDGLIREGEAAG